MIDKINKLEKLGILSHAALWNEMRFARNSAAHEYPNHPELTAIFLNQVFNLSPALIEILNNIQKAIRQIINLQS